jgi:DNA-directed RNA polymerase specialized sigma subunit
MVKTSKLFGIEVPESIKYAIYNSYKKISLIVYGDDGVIDIIESTTDKGLYSKVRREIKHIILKEEYENIDIDECYKDDDWEEVKRLNHIIDSELLLKRIGFNELSLRYQKCLSYRFGLDNDKVPHTLEETAELFGVTRDRIRQIEQKAIRLLKMYNQIIKN